MSVHPRLPLMLAGLLLGSAAIQSAGGADDPTELVLPQMKRQFQGDVRASEVRMLECIVRGERYKPNDRGGPSIRADRLAWICTTPQAAALVTYKGVRLE